MVISENSCSGVIKSYIHSSAPCTNSRSFCICKYRAGGIDCHGLWRRCHRVTMCDCRHTFTHSANSLVKFSIDPTKPLSLNKLISDYMYAHAVNDALEQLAPALTSYDNISYGNISSMTSSISVLILFNTLVVSSSLPVLRGARTLCFDTSHKPQCSLQLRSKHPKSAAGAAVAQAWGRCVRSGGGSGMRAVWCVHGFRVLLPTVYIAQS